MTAPSSLAFPGSRTLAGWWRQLVPLRPQALWVGHLFLHRVEALVASVSSQPLAALDCFVLQVVAAESAASAQPAAEDFLRQLDTRLHLGEGFLRQALRGLAAEALVEPGTEGVWGITAQGSSALENGAFPRTRQERRVFYFLDQDYLSGGRQLPEGTTAQGANAPRSAPHYLSVPANVAVACSVGEEWGFDVRHLNACVGQAPEWKKQHGFPEDVREILSSAAGAASSAAWQRVVVDRPERLPVLLARVDAGADEAQLLGFAVRQEGWSLQTHHPVFRLAGDWPEVFPGIGPSDAECHQAWRLWCQPRGLPAEEVEACTLLPEGVRLHVKAPATLVQRLRASRSDALKGEAWLLIGEGALRSALALHFTS